jgi:hypothetical protein
MPRLTLNPEELVVESFATPAALEAGAMAVTPRTNEPGCVPGTAATVCYC